MQGIRLNAYVTKDDTVAFPLRADSIWKSLLYYVINNIKEEIWVYFMTLTILNILV